MSAMQSGRIPRPLFDESSSEESNLAATDTDESEGMSEMEELYSSPSEDFEGTQQPNRRTRLAG